MATHRKWLVRCHYPSRSSDLLAFFWKHPILCLHAHVCPSAMSSPSSLSDSSDKKSTDAYIRNFALVARIMKGALPENAKIAKEAKECMQECVSEFISFITSEGTLPMFQIFDFVS